jgi:tetratricopeptide (TPR) repeat protein
MNALKHAQAGLPVAFFNCVESKSSQPDDLLLTMTEELAAEGDREPLERLERGEDVAGIFNRILAVPRLIVVDEAQRLLVGSTGAMPNTMASYLERWSRTIGARGRLLLLTSREFEFARWGDQVEFRRVGPLETEEAEAFIRASLRETGRTEAIPESRITDVVTWLGCNPRAIKLLVSVLARDSLDDLIGVAAEAWEARDRSVSPELLREFEEAVLKRAEERLEGPARVFLHRISVLRQPAENRALQALKPEGSDLALLRGDLVARFMLELRRNRYEMHPVLRDTIRARMTGGERRRAHLGAGHYYAAPFRARRALGTAEKLGARFIEARYHFTLAESEVDLADISQRFEAHYRTQFGHTTPVPTDPEERDERIILLSALLQARGAKGLEYYLARCLVARDRPGDAERALPHARRATGPQSLDAAWVLRIRLEARVFGAAKAAQVAREGVALLPPGQNLSALYQAASEILARNSKSDEAIEFLQQGISRTSSEQSLAEMYQAAGEILQRDGKPDEAIEFLRNGINKVSSVYNFPLYAAAGEILNQHGKFGEALEILRRGIKEVDPRHNLHVLYVTAAAILRQAGEPDQAINLLLEGYGRIPAKLNGFRLLENALTVAYAEARLDNLRYLSVPEPQADLRTILCALAGNDLKQAAHFGTESIRKNPGSFALIAQTAFAWLSIGEPSTADKTLKMYPRQMVDIAGGPITWLKSFVALELGQEQEARRVLGIYLGDGSLDSEQTVDKASVLKAWDSVAGAAWFFPRLAPSLTGLARTVVRHQYGGPVLTDADLAMVCKNKAEPFLGAPAVPLSSFDPARVLIAMRPDRWNGLYVLGCYDAYKTLYAQQCRALTLIHALFEAGELRQGSRLGVVGGGAAGVTAAVAAARKGARVILFERSKHILPLQRQNTKRYLHPHIFDWPTDGSTNPQAGLPLLDWRANRSNVVAAEITRGFDETFTATGNIDLRSGVAVQDVEQIPSGDETRRIQILGAEGGVSEIVDTAIIAVGFGLERRSRLGIESPPYWEDDGLEQALGASSDHPQRILVSGAGDGALIDLLRASIRDFRHEDILALLPEGDVLRKLQDELEAIETKTKRASLITDLPLLNLQKIYGEVSLDPTFVDSLRKQIRDDTAVWFNFTSAGCYTLASSLLNRFIVAVLCRLGAIKPKLARLDEKSIRRGAEGEYLITWPRSAELQIFDRVLIRHGPPGDYLAQVFPELEVVCAPLRGKLRTLNLTSSLDRATYAYFV